MNVASSAIPAPAHRRAATLRRSTVAAVALSGSLLLSACAGAGTSEPRGSSNRDGIAASVPQRHARDHRTLPPSTRSTICSWSSGRSSRPLPRRGPGSRRRAWQVLAGANHVPVVFGDEVVFAYRGDADTVEWRGSFNGWSAPGLAGSRVGRTDLWIAHVQLPAASRVEYKIILDGEDWLVDPANPATAYSGLTGVNDVVALPRLHRHRREPERSGVDARDADRRPLDRQPPPGYTSTSSTRRPLRRARTTPSSTSSTERLRRRAHRRAAQVLDNLIASGRIRPVLVVFTDAREPGNPPSTTGARTSSWPTRSSTRRSSRPSSCRPSTARTAPIPIPTRARSRA